MNFQFLIPLIIMIVLAILIWDPLTRLHRFKERRAMRRLQKAQEDWNNSQ